MDPQQFAQAMCSDARNLVIGSAIHACTPSCFKYHSNRASLICRHNFYHVAEFAEQQGAVVRRRRRGKPLRGCVAIYRDPRYGMGGRILSFQLHPWECPTKYSFLVLLRCNVDVQDMRRVLPPSMWMTADDKPEPPATDCGDNPYAQRILQYSAGEQSSWGWFQHLNTTPVKRFDLPATLDWHAIWTSLLVPVDDAGADNDLPHHNSFGSSAHADPVFTEFRTAAVRAASLAFMDAVNAGYYINSYTTKVNPGMGNVLQRLCDGVRRLRDEWDMAEENRRAAADREDDPQAATSVPSVPATPTNDSPLGSHTRLQGEFTSANETTRRCDTPTNTSPLGSHTRLQSEFTSANETTRRRDSFRKTV